MRAEDVEPAPASARVFDWVDAGDGTIVALTTDGRVRILGASGPARELELDWNPATAATELDWPRSDHCLFRPAGPEATLAKSNTPFRAIDVAQGVVWISGCSGTVARIPPPWVTAERVVLSAFDSDGSGEDIAHLTAIRALCADRVLVASQGAGELGDDRERLWWIETSADSTRPDRLSARALGVTENPRPANATDMRSETWSCIASPPCWPARPRTMRGRS